MFGLTLGWFALYVFVAGGCWTVGARVGGALYDAVTRRTSPPSA